MVTQLACQTRIFTTHRLVKAFLEMAWCFAGEEKGSGTNSANLGGRAFGNGWCPAFRRSVLGGNRLKPTHQQLKPVPFGSGTNSQMARRVFRTSTIGT
jgi:hypothetical protein